LDEEYASGLAASQNLRLLGIFGGGGLVQLNPLGKLLRELQGQINPDWTGVSLQLTEQARQWWAALRDSRNEINVYKPVEDTTYSSGFVVWALE